MYYHLLCSWASNCIHYYRHYNYADELEKLEQCLLALS